MHTGDQISRRCFVGGWPGLFALGLGVAMLDPARGEVTIEHLATWGGEANAVAIQGNLAYMGSGPRMLVVDVSDPNSPVELSGLYADGIVRGIAVQGGLAYVAARGGAYEFLVVNVSAPTNPQIVGWYNDYESRLCTLPDGAVVYVGSGDGICVMDVSDPQDPHPIAELTGCTVPGCWYRVWDLALSGSLLYVADTDYLRIVDVSNPENPVHLSSTPIPETSRTGVAVEGDRAYVAHLDGLSIIDVAAPLSPQIIGGYVLDGAEDVEVADQIAYVAGWNDGLVILDVSNPNSPTWLGSLTTGTPVNRVTLDGTTAYICDRAEGMIVVDVSDPANPTRRGRKFSPCCINATTLDGNLLHVADWWGVSILDVTDKRNPQLVGAYQTGPGTWELKVRDELAYVSAGHSGLEILDVTDPANPTYVGGYPTGGSARGIALTGNLALVGQESPGTVRVIDVSDPQSPTFVSTIPVTEALDLEIADDYVFIARSVSSGVVEFFDPAQPLVCQYFAPAAYDLEVVGDLLYVAGRTSSQNLAVFKLADPCAPNQIGSYQPPGTGSSHPLDGVAVRGGRAYLAGDNKHGLHIVDVSNPEQPTFLAEYPTPDRASHITVDEPYVYISDQYGGVVIFLVPVDGDFDGDGDVDLDDFGSFASCYNGSARPPADACPEGIDADLDNDGDVDLDDFAIFAANYTGSL